MKVNFYQILFKQVPQMHFGVRILVLNLTNAVNEALHRFNAHLKNLLGPQDL